MKTDPEDKLHISNWISYFFLVIFSTFNKRTVRPSFRCNSFSQSSLVSLRSQSYLAMQTFSARIVQTVYDRHIEIKIKIYRWIVRKLY